MNDDAKAIIDSLIDVHRYAYVKCLVHEYPDRPERLQEFERVWNGYLTILTAPKYVTVPTNDKVVSQ